MGRPASLLPTGLLALALAGCTAGTWSGGQAPSVSSAGPRGNAAGSASPAAQTSFDVGQSVFFAPQTAYLTPQARRNLKSLVDHLRNDPPPITIVRHGDEHSTREYSIALGAERAEAVKAYLVALGLPAQHLETTTLGSERPAAFGSSAEALALDRRADLHFESLAAVPQH
jgi:peptidoglycan-associated lipoprotein